MAESKDQAFQRRMREAQDEVRKNGGKIDADYQTGKVYVERQTQDGAHLWSPYTKKKEIK